mmetsp:Transcript_101208/g.325152  ORF Transcript_101208/g.325152 Transcript_101208/m.325152 type:complete len:346 (+) Transcript_101208:2348-3385(+)
MSLQIIRLDGDLREALAGRGRQRDGGCSVSFGHLCRRGAGALRIAQRSAEERLPRGVLNDAGRGRRHRWLRVRGGGEDLVCIDELDVVCISAESPERGAPPHDGRVQVRERGLAVRRRGPIRDFLEVLDGRTDDPVQSIGPDERRGPGRRRDRGGDVVLEEGDRRDGVRLVAPGLRLGLDLVDPHLLDVVGVLPAHHLANGVVRLAIVTDEDDAELGIQSDVLFELFELFQCQRPHALVTTAAGGELDARVEGAREKRRHSVQPVFLLQLRKALEDASFDDIRDQMGPRAQRDKLAQLAPALQLAVERRNPWVRRVPRVARVDARGPTAARALQGVVHVGDDLEP